MVRTETVAREQAKLSAELRALRVVALELAQGVQAAAVAVATPDPAEWYRALTGKRLDPWQAAFVRSPGRKILLNCGRQVGKTEAVAVKSAHRARFRARRVGILSPSLYQSGIMFRRCRNLVLLSGARLVRDTARELEIEGGGAIVAFPGDRPDLAVRGDTLDDLLVDEAARIRDGVITAAAPTQATREDHLEVMLSTPRGRRGVFWQEWSAGGEEWERFAVKSSECPRISPAFLERMERRLGPLYEQEFCCAFLSDGFGLFAEADLEAMFAQVPLGIDLPEADDVRDLDF